MNLGAYFRRIGYRQAASPTLETLYALHRAHATAIPFENLDIQRGLAIGLDIDTLEAKLVGARRGGYCFEQNTLALHALRDIGFEVIACEARVRAGATRVAPRTHMVLVATIDGTRWLWDTGFGGDTPLEPLRLDRREEVEQGGTSYRVARERGGLRVLQTAAGSDWLDLYAFVAEARELVDFEVGNWYTSTHPSSHFVTTLTAQRRTGDGSHVLRNLSFTVTSGGKSETRTIAHTDLLPLLAAEFGLDLPDDTKFLAIERIRQTYVPA